MKLETQPLILSQVTQTLSLEGSGLVRCLFWLMPSSVQAGREDAPASFHQAVLSGDGVSGCLSVMVGEDIGLTWYIGHGRKGWRGVSDVCFDGVNKSSYFIEQLLYAGSRAQHFSSINSFLLLNDAEVRTWSPRFTEEVNETLEAQVACQGHSR